MISRPEGHTLHAMRREAPPFAMIISGVVIVSNFRGTLCKRGRGSPGGLNARAARTQEGRYGVERKIQQLGQISDAVSFG